MKNSIEYAYPTMLPVAKNNFTNVIYVLSNEVMQRKLLELGVTKLAPFRIQRK